MEYANLGRSGLRVSRICLGMLSFANESDRPWVLNEGAAAPLVRRAVEAGVNFFDTANAYSNGHGEIATGRLLRQFTKREDVVVATKVFMNVDPGENGGGLSRRHIHKAIDDSLRRLGMDYVDLYQIHRFDERVGVEETMDALDEVVRAGKARYLGASSMYAWQFVKLQAAARRAGGAQFVSMQNHYNLIYREEEREMIPACKDLGVGVLPWSPLARGILAGNASEQTLRARFDTFPDGRYEHSSDLEIIATLRDIAEQRGVPQAHVALAWLLHQSGVTAPIFGATKTAHIDDAVAALTLVLSAEELAALAAPYRPHAIHGHE
jgi:1-deoxyxylulose-5-phosphate synthase